MKVVPARVAFAMCMPASTSVMVATSGADELQAETMVTSSVDSSQ